MPTSSFNQHFPGYEIIAELGRSNARVLKARSLATGELVAIKHFSFNTDASTLQRFQQESEIMTTIKNYNIVKVREVQLDAEMPYIVMEFIEGGDLRSLLKDGKALDVAIVIRLGLQMVEAFKAIHQLGIIHRDIKPENIMYRMLHSGELHFLLTDFGIAKLREQSITVSGQSLMTYEYASPEQFDDPKGVSMATDYYSLGVVLYECLSGKLPFPLEEGRMHTFINKVMSMPPPPLSIPEESRLPENLKTLVNRLLAKGIDDRVKDDRTLKKLLKQAEMEELLDQAEESPVISPVDAMPAQNPNSEWNELPEQKEQPSDQSKEIPVKQLAPDPAVLHIPPAKSSGREGIIISIVALIIIIGVIVSNIERSGSDVSAMEATTDSPRVTTDSTPVRSIEMDTAKAVMPVADTSKPWAGINLADGTFYDDFSNNKYNWGLVNDTNKIFTITNGKLRIQCLSARYQYGCSLLFDLDPNKDFTVSLTARWAEGTDESAFGIRYCSDYLESSFYNFAISANGSYCIGYFKNDEWKYLKEWTSSSYINQGAASNTLTATKKGDEISYYINDNLVTTLPFTETFDRHFGVTVGGAQTVDFDNFILKGSDNDKK